MKTITVFLALSFLFPIFAFSSPVPFDEIQSFHDRRISLLLKNYGLENSVEVTVIISPEKMKSLNIYKKRKRFQLPGLLLGKQDVPEEKSTIGVFEILDSLRNYKRNVTLIKKKNVSDEEVKALESGLKEYLALRDNEPVAIENKTFSLESEMKNWRADLERSVYQSFFNGKFWAWVPISILLVLLFSLFMFFALKKSFKSLKSNSEKNSEIGAGSEILKPSEYENATGEDTDDGFHEVLETETSQILEVDPIDIYEKILEFQAVSKYELFNMMWNHFPNIESQISFYEILNSHLDLTQKENFKEVFFEAFKLSPSVRLNNLKGKTLSLRDLSAFQRSLLLAGLVNVHPKREKALSAVYPKYGARVDNIIEASLDKFFSVVYFLFPDKVTDFISKSESISSELSDRILELMVDVNFSDEPNDFEIEGFIKFVESDTFANKIGSPEVDTKILKLVENLSDSIIFNSQKITQDKKDFIMEHLPNLHWINAESPERLKAFLLSISAAELMYVSRECPDFNQLLKCLDERGFFRVQERLDEALINKDQVKILNLRKSIKKYFTPVVKELSYESVLQNAA